MSMRRVSKRSTLAILVVCLPLVGAILGIACDAIRSEQGRRNSGQAEVLNSSEISGSSQNPPQPADQNPQVRQGSSPDAVADEGLHMPEMAVAVSADQDGDLSPSLPSDDSLEDLTQLPEVADAASSSPLGLDAVANESLDMPEIAVAVSADQDGELSPSLPSDDSLEELTQLPGVAEAVSPSPLGLDAVANESLDMPEMAVAVSADQDGDLSPSLPSDDSLEDLTPFPEVAEVADGNQGDPRDASCVATLSSPSSGATVTFPQSFSWSTTGACSNVSVAFATSSSPSTVAIFTGASSPFSVSQSQWNSVVGIIGNSSTYYWSVGETSGSTYTARSSWRSFIIDSLPDIHISPSSITIACPGASPQTPRAQPETASRQVLCVLQTSGQVEGLSATVKESGGQILTTVDERIVWSLLPYETDLSNLKALGATVITNQQDIAAAVSGFDLGATALATAFADATTDQRTRTPVDLEHPLVNDAWDPGALNLENYLENLRPFGLHRSDGCVNNVVAGFVGNSDDMTGTVTVAVMFVESNGAIDANTYTWTTGDEDNVLAGIASGLAWWASQAQANGKTVSFNVLPYRHTDVRLQQGYEPILHPSTDVPLIVSAIMANLGYNSGDHLSRVTAFNTWLRSNQGTDRAYTAFVSYNPSPASNQYTDGYAAWAYLGGPYTNLLYRSFGWSFDRVFTHESGHIFKACDEYYAPGYGGCNGCGICSHEVNNGNCEYCNPNSVDCMMKSNTWNICAFTPGQLGWESTDEPDCLTISNDGGGTLNVSAINKPSWVTLTPPLPYNIAAGASQQVCLTPICGACTGSTLTGTLQISSNDADEPMVGVPVSVECPPVTPGCLSVATGDGLTSSGQQGGPFSPSTKTYTLQNTGSNSLNWSVTDNANWVSESSPSSGSLAAGASTTVTVSITSNANSLAAGSYSAMVIFTNSTNGCGNTTRSVALTVVPVGQCSVARDLTDPTLTYCPEGAKHVCLNLTPPMGATAIGVEDTPPSVWVVSNISNGGQWDAVNQKVKWGPFFTPFPATLCYDVTPPNGEDGTKCFAGSYSVDGVNALTCGESCVDKSCRRLICADEAHSPCSPCGDCSNITCGDGRVELGEMTGYACAWKRGCNDDIACMTRAAFIWKNGECYCWDQVQQNWYPTSCPAPASGVCAGSFSACEAMVLMDRFVPGSVPLVTRVVSQPNLQTGEVVVELHIALPPEGTVVALEERIPGGCQVSAVDNAGVFDPVNEKIKWGPFFNEGEVPPVIRYTITTPSTQQAVFTGEASMDGSIVEPTNGDVRVESGPRE